MEKFKRWTEIIFIVVGLITTAFGFIKFIDARYAFAPDVSNRFLSITKKVTTVEDTLKYKITEDVANNTQQRVWQLEDRYGSNLEKADQSVKEEYRTKKSLLSKIQKKLDDMKAKPVSEEAPE
jgi:ABC-type transport system involved in cytochrome bd biosynthesis fused ATPase/permease subunit